MTTDLGVPRLDGSDELDSAVGAADTVLPLAAAGFTVDPLFYPIILELDGEIVRANAGTLNVDKVTFSGCDRGLNQVTKAHSAGAPIKIAFPFRVALGHAQLAAAFEAAIVDPPVIPPTTPASWVSTTPSTEPAFTLTHTINRPAVAAGDHLLIAWTSNGAAATATGPAFPWVETNHDLNPNQLLRYYVRKYDAADVAGTETVTTSDVMTSSAETLHFTGGFDSGVQGVGWDISADPGFTTTSTAVDPVPVTAPWGASGNLFVALGSAGSDSPTVTAYPANYINGSFATAAQTMAVATRQLDSATDDPGPFTISLSRNNKGATFVLRGGGTGVPPVGVPVIPAFSVTPTVINSGTDVASIINVGAIGENFLLGPGPHDLDNVRYRTDQHIRFATGAFADGDPLNIDYAFRPENALTNGVAIGGDPAGARPLIVGYGNRNNVQDYAAIQGTPHDPLLPEFLYQLVEDVFVYHLDLEENGGNGVKMGSNWTVYDCEIHGHKVTGIACDRGVGGVVYGNILYWNALDPATGAGANGAHWKGTWINGDEGRTDVTPIDPAKAPFRIAHNVCEAFDRNGGPGFTAIALWADLDCKDGIFEFNTISDGELGIFFEGCNDLEASNNTLTRCNAQGLPAFNADFRAGAITLGESTNCRVLNNTVIDSDTALCDRQSNRSGDWFRPTEVPDTFVNYAWAAGPRYWITAGLSTAVPTSTGRSNMWTGGNEWDGNVCQGTIVNGFIISEGTDGGGMTTHGSIDLPGLTITNNTYPPGAVFYTPDQPNVPLSLAAWQGIGRQ